jgi:hypothetical protein
MAFVIPGAYCVVEKIQRQLVYDIFVPGWAITGDAFQCSWKKFEKPFEKAKALKKKALFSV